MNRKFSLPKAIIFIMTIEYNKTMMRGQINENE